MRPYWALFSAQLQEALQYRVAALAGLGTQVFWGVIRVMIFEAFYLSATTAMPIQLAQVVTYVWLGQCFFRMLPSWPEKDAAQKIRDGNVAYELVRPLDLFWFWYTRGLASLVGPVILRAPPMFLIAYLFLGMKGPASFLYGLFWAASLLLAFFVSAGIITLLSFSLFWTISGEGLSRLIPVLSWLASGSLLPLVFFPEWLRAIVEFLPFSACLDTPAQIYVGQYPIEEVPWLLARQLFWVVLLIGCGRLVLSRGLGRVVIQGG